MHHSSFLLFAISLPTSRPNQLGKDSISPMAIKVNCDEVDEKQEDLSQVVDPLPKGFPL